MSEEIFDCHNWYPGFQHMCGSRMLAACYEGKQIALHRISYQKKDMVVNPTLKQTMDAENILLEQDKVIDFLLKASLTKILL